MNKNKIIELKNVSKSFFENGKELKILENVNLEVFEGEKIAITGPSGSGKSTVLSLLAGLDNPDEGLVIVDDNIVNQMKEKTLSKYRNQVVGIIFQSFELILPFSVFENVSSPQDISGKANYKKVEELIDKVNLKSKLNSPVTNLSGGEKQRVAIARALSNSPKIILADEPTGSLDRTTGKHVLETLVDLVKLENKTLIVITHDEEIAKKMDRILHLKDKKLVQL